MDHLLPVLGTIVALLALTDRGELAFRTAGRLGVGFVRGLVDYLSAMGRWYVRTAFGPSGER